jgi:hypothetical protein
VYRIAIVLALSLLTEIILGWLAISLLASVIVIVLGSFRGRRLDDEGAERERRRGSEDRREGLRDRRAGRPDRRSERFERRSGRTDRRSGVGDRRGTPA